MSEGTFRRISIRGGEFRKVIKGDERLIESDTLDVVIVNAAGVGRMFYNNEYDANKSSSPICWSSDTTVPDPEVPEETRQSGRCMDCTQNIKGSGNGNARACKFSQRIAVTLDGAPDEIYQMQLPANALFGGAARGWMSMQDYAKHLAKHDTSVITVVTKIQFEDDGYIPKLRFRPVRVLKPEELEEAVEMSEHSDTARALAMLPPPKNWDNESPFGVVEGFVYDTTI